MTGEIEVFKCRLEDVSECVKGLWSGLAKEMFEIEHLTVPSETNSNRWVKYASEKFG